MAVPREFCTANYAQAGKSLSPGHGYRIANLA